MFKFASILTSELSLRSLLLAGLLLRVRAH
jgi:hypothetical protein